MKRLLAAALLSAIACASHAQSTYNLSPFNSLADCTAAAQKVGGTVICDTKFTTQPVVVPPSPQVWTKLADEYGSFAVGSAQTVRFGAGSAFIQKTITGAGACTVGFFVTDPAVGTTKECDVLSSSATPTPPDTTAPPAKISKVTFAPDTSTVIPNPERGWYLLAGSLLDSAAQFDSGLVAIRNTYGFRLALAETILPTSTLTSAQLTQINANMAQARVRGLKLILRFQYGSSPSDPALSRIQAHAAQLKPYLAANRDVLAYVQAGFIGSYGEWADSANGNDSKANKRAVKDVVIDMVPAELPINFTQVYPPTEDWYASQPAISPPDAFSGSKKSRTGYHSDCFLTGNGDSYFITGPGTVKDFTITMSRASQRAYVAAATEYVPFGTETCIGSQGSSQQMRTGCTDANDETGLSGGIMNEGPRYHLTYMNNSYAMNFINAWKSGGCYTQIENMMGYRIQLDSLSYATTAPAGSSAVLTLSLNNYGWSRIFQERHVLATLVKNGAADIACSSADDLRRVLPSQSTAPVAVSISCAVPAGAALGDYAIYVGMPDKTPALAKQRAYAVRPANANAGAQSWDDSLGRFATGAVVTVTAAGR